MNTKTICSTLMVLTLVAMTATCIPPVNSVEFNAQDETLSFLKDVVKLDISKYNISLISDQNPVNVINSENQEEIRYLLKNTDNTIDTTCLFNNGALVWCTMYVHNGSPFYTEVPSSSVIEYAEAILGRYYTLTGLSRFQAMKELLSKVTITEDVATYRSDSAKLLVFSDGNTQQFSWTNISSGIDGPIFSLEFVNGTLETFNDQQSLFSIGKFTVNISQANAINLAMEEAKHFSWKVGSDLATAQEVTQFTVLNDPVQSQLSLQPRDNSTLYPYWRIDLYLDKVYAGGVSSIAVGIWADTGTIDYIKALSYGGIPNTGVDSQQTGTPINNILLLLIVCAIILSSAVAFVLKRKKKIVSPFFFLY
ncbi:MAG: hypothetical protein NWF05_08465 [Candidatus Bathyarchaeota archaeon]|nr:hypothetical protein [Candidatus Bathyarchaeota archaeon]